MKKTLTILLVALLSFCVFAEGSTEKTTEKTVVNFWHTFTAGVQGDNINAAVEQFNATIGAENNIEVVATYQGAYNDLSAKLLSAVAAGEDIPQIIVGERSNNIPVYWDNGILLDMTDYVKNSKTVKMDNFIPALTGFSYSPNGELISFPYIRSSFLLYYNADMFASIGIEEPKSFADLEEAGKKLTKGEVAGFCFWHDFSPEYAVCAEMGSEIFTKNGEYPSHLTDGTMTELLSWWDQGVEEGWIAKYPVSNTGKALVADLCAGRLAAVIQSTGNLGDVMKSAKESGLNIKVAAFPAWYNGEQKAPIGGGNIAMVSAGNDKKVLDAAWKFMEFLLSDDQVANINKNTGYLVTTKSALNSEIIKEYWAENPEFRVAYDATLAFGVELPFSLYKPNYSGLIKAPISSLIVEQSITPRQAVQQILAESKKVFPNM